MPQKPIKHGIKVVCLCCAYTSHLLGFEVYIGKINSPNEDGSAIGIIDRLIHGAKITAAKGRTLYTDNWYTSIALAKYLYEEYGWTIVGTITPTAKVDRKGDDVPFIKLSNGAMVEVERGWFREATLKIKTKKGRVYYIQCTTWRDKKQVMFIHTHVVGPSVGHEVFRHVKGRKRRVKLAAPKVQKDYMEFYNAVDRNDRDSSDYSTSIKSNRFYLRIFFWLLDRIVLATYLIVIFMAKNGIGDPKWEQYASKYYGRRDFQIDLGLWLVSYGIEVDWKDPDDRPKWMRRIDFLPCQCKVCYFCKNKHTNAINHNQAKIIFSPSPDRADKRKRMFTMVTSCVNIAYEIETKPKYCKMSYANHSEEIKNSVDRHRRQNKEYSNQSKLGCPICQETICKVCWPKYVANGHSKG